MATVTAFTKERMEAIEAASVVDGHVDGDDLILVRYDTSEINAGSVRGPTGSPGITEEEFNDHLSVGSVIDYIGTVAPSSKWLTMVGQTIVGGETTYAELWGKIPATMKSGSDIIMPDTRGRVSVGLNTGDADFNVIGEVGGAKTHTLTQAQLPAATVPMAPPEQGITINPPSTIVAISDPGHVHDTGLSGSTLIDLGSGLTQIGDGDVEVRGLAFPNEVEENITGITATVDIEPFAVVFTPTPFQSGNLGSGEAHNNMQPYVVFLKMIKVL